MNYSIQNTSIAKIVYLCVYTLRCKARVAWQLRACEHIRAEYLIFELLTHVHACIAWRAWHVAKVRVHVSKYVPYSYHSTIYMYFFVRTRVQLGARGT